MLAPWHEFYALLGTAAATLVALMFVAVSVGVGLLSAERSTATRIYMSPIILHYASVLLVSLIALVPGPALDDRMLGVVVGLCGAVGLLYSLVITVRLWRDSKSEIVDRFAYGTWPFVAYGGMLLAAFLIPHRAGWGPVVLAGSLLLLLLVNVRNAWDLTVTFAQRHGEARRSGAPPAPPPQSPQS